MRQGCGGCLGSFFFLAAFLAAGAGLSYWGWTILQDARASANWPSVQGQITQSVIEESRDEDGTSYGAEIRYEYVVNDQQYTGDVVNFGEYSGNYSHAEEIVNRYTVGQSVPVYYDPAEVTTAVLEPGVSTSSYFVLAMGLCFASVSFIFGPIMLFSRFRRQ